MVCTPVIAFGDSNCADDQIDFLKSPVTINYDLVHLKTSRHITASSRKEDSNAYLSRIVSGLPGCASSDRDLDSVKHADVIISRTRN
jgi:hypothetical protein